MREPDGEERVRKTKNENAVTNFEGRFSMGTKPNKNISLFFLEKTPMMILSLWRLSPASTQYEGVPFSVGRFDSLTSQARCCDVDPCSV